MTTMKNQYLNASKLGSHQFYGAGYRVLTLRGWVIVDNWQELQEELNRIKSLRKEDYGNTNKSQA